MHSDFSCNDPRSIWQSQPTEPSPMTLEKIRRKTRELRSKTRRQLLGSIAAPLVVIASDLICVKRLNNPALRSLFVVAIAWSLAGLYFFNRGMWSAALPEASALTTSIQSYRQEVQRRRSLFGRVLLWQFGPAVLLIANIILFLAMVGGRSVFPNALPFLILVVIWLAAYFVIRMRDRRELQREIDKLNEVERENTNDTK
jgi:hypothetical protein